jgi:hypothetical protein
LNRPTCGASTGQKVHDIHEKNYSKGAAKAFGRVVCKNIEETTKDENIEVTPVPVLHLDITLVCHQVPVQKKAR